MGSYLSHPETRKDSSDDTSDRLIAGTSSMQGWRLTQEDAHNCLLNFDDDASLFAVYDGHGGHEVAAYCSENLPNFIKNTPAYKEGNYEEALISGFLGFDALVKSPEVLDVLKDLAQSKKSDDESSDEDVNNLYEEATMPIEDVIEKYVAGTVKPTAAPKAEETSDGSKPGSSQTPDACGGSTSTDSNEQPSGSSAKNGSEAIEKTEVEQNGEVAKEAEAKPETEPVENGKSSIKGKGKAVIKPIQVKNPFDFRLKKTAEELYKNWLQCGDESEESSDEEDDSFEEPKVEESSEDEYEGVNQAIEVENSEDSSEESVEEEESEEKQDQYALERDFLRNLEEKEKPGFSSGCTAVVALLKGNQLYVANAGDSRCVVCRAGKAVEMSFDHKPETDTEESRIIKAGGKVNSEGRVNGGLNLSRAIGDHAYKQNTTLSDREQMVTALPDIKTLTINPEEDEFILLACDGIWNCISNQEAVEFVRDDVLKGEKKMSEICEILFDHLLSKPVDATDNMSAIIVKFKQHSLKRPISPIEEEKSLKRLKSDEVESEAKNHTTA